MKQPTPTDLKITQASPPMGIHLTALRVGLGCLNPATHQVKGGHRQDQDQPVESLFIADFTGLKLETSRLIIQETLFDIKSQTEFIKSFQAGGFVTNNGPLLETVLGLNMRQGQMNGAKPVFAQPDVVQEDRLALFRHQSLDFCACAARMSDPKRRFEANSKAPTQRLIFSQGYIII